jgi:hypothetical protein
MVIGTHSVPYEAVRAARLPRENYARSFGVSTYQMIQDLVLDDLNHLERLHRSNRINKHVAMDTDEML